MDKIRTIRIVLSVEACGGIAKIGIENFDEEELLGFLTAERAAWLLLVLKHVEDRPEWFPRGKWATIQHIEAQVEEQVCALCKFINARPPSGSTG